MSPTRSRPLPHAGPGPTAPGSARRPPAGRRGGLPAWLGAAALVALLVPGPGGAAPFTPARDEQVLAEVGARARDEQARELAALRSAWQRAPRDPQAALALARGCVGALLATSDPRHAGCAQAALAPWWREPDPPPGVRVQRAVLLQFEHRFDEALADLAAAIEADPADAVAWSWRTAILLVLARYADAASACERLAPLTSPLLAAACRAQVLGLTGRAAAAAAQLRAALAAARAAPADERLWSLVRLAEIEERRGDFSAAEAAFREALALPRRDVYLRAAYADFLLDRSRPAEVLTLLAADGAADVLLLRLAIAGARTQAPRALQWRQEMAARFAAAAQRGDTTHRKEQARFALDVLADPAAALPLAQQNWEQQREPADARLLLEAALAARLPAAAAPVKAWAATSRIESQALQGLLARLPAAGPGATR